MLMLLGKQSASLVHSTWDWFLKQLQYSVYNVQESRRGRACIMIKEVHAITCNKTNVIFVHH